MDVFGKVDKKGGVSKLSGEGSIILPPCCRHKRGTFNSDDTQCSSRGSYVWMPLVFVLIWIAKKMVKSHIQSSNEEAGNQLPSNIADRASEGSIVCQSDRDSSNLVQPRIDATPRRPFLSTPSHIQRSHEESNDLHDGSEHDASPQLRIDAATNSGETGPQSQTAPSCVTDPCLSLSGIWAGFSRCFGSTPSRIQHSKEESDDLARTQSPGSTKATAADSSCSTACAGDSLTSVGDGSTGGNLVRRRS